MCLPHVPTQSFGSERDSHLDFVSSGTEGDLCVIFKRMFQVKMGGMEWRERERERTDKKLKLLKNLNWTTESQHQLDGREKL